MKILFVYSSLVLEKVGNSYYHNFLNPIIKRYSFLGELTICTSLKEVVRSNREKVDLSKVNYVRLNKENTIKSLVDKSYNNGIIRRLVPECDLLIIHQPDGVGARAANYARKIGKPYLTVVIGCVWDSLWNYDWRGKILAPISFARMQKIVSRSNYAIYVTEKFLQNRYPTGAKQIPCSDVVVNEVNCSVIDKRRQKFLSFNKSSQINIITLGGLDVPYKGQQLIVEAISRLNKNGWNYHYFVCGDGTGERLNSLAQKRGIMDCVHNIGLVSHDKVIELLNIMDIYAQPSYLEGLPRALVEAMSCGMPAIGSNVGGIPELLQEDVLFKKGSVSQIVKILSRLPKEWIPQIQRNYTRSHDFGKDVLEKRRLLFLASIKNELEQKQ